MSSLALCVLAIDYPAIRYIMDVSRTVQRDPPQTGQFGHRYQANSSQNFCGPYGYLNCMVLIAKIVSQTKDPDQHRNDLVLSSFSSLSALAPFAAFVACCVVGLLFVTSSGGLSRITVIAQRCDGGP